MSGSTTSEVWITRSADLVLVEWNACGCHPKDVCMQWGNKFREKGWYGSRNKSAWTKHLKRKGWERL